MKNLLSLLVIVLLFNGGVNAQRITVTIAGTGFGGTYGDGGPARYAKLTSPEYICTDPSGNIYFANTYIVRKISAKTGIISTFAGGGTATADGLPATSVALSVSGLCSDIHGNIYISSSVKVKKVDVNTNIITNIAGTGGAGFSGDGGPATSANFNVIYAICADNAGNLYLSDKGNRRVRKIDLSTGIVTTVAGSGGGSYAGDGGPATAASLSDPRYICVNMIGDLYVMDQSASYLREIKRSTGIISRVVGGGGTLYSCPALSCMMGPVSGICSDGADNIYFNESSCSCRRADMTTDSVYAVAGDFSIESFRNDTISLYAWMNNNYGICMDADKNLFVADKVNSRVRKLIQMTHAPAFAFGRGQSIRPCPGYVCQLDSLFWITDLDSAQTETWTVVTSPLHGSLAGFPANAISNGIHETVKPSGLTYFPAVSYIGSDSFKVRVSDGTFSDTITVYVSVQIPDTAVITGSHIVCQAANTALFASIPVGTWSSVNPTATVGTFSGVVHGVSPGVDTIIYTAGIGCPVATMHVVTVNPSPSVGTITGSDTVCAGGGHVTLTESVGGGVWSSWLSSIASIGSSTGDVTGVRAGYTIITYTVTNSLGCTSYATKTITVISTPAGTTSGTSFICVGLSTTLINSIPGGIWSVTNVNATVGSVTGVVTGVYPGLDTIMYTHTIGCIAPAKFTMTVAPFSSPDPGTIIGPDNVCQGATILLANTAGGGTWSVSNTKAAVSTAGVVTGVNPGADSVFYTVYSVCGSESAIKVVNIMPLPDAGVISGSNNVCVDSFVIFTDALTGGIWSAVRGNAHVSGSGIVYGVSVGVDTIVYQIANECGTDMATKEINVVKCVPDDLSQPIAATALTVAPNPSSGTFTVQLSSPLQESAEVIITNMLGQTIHTFTTATNKATNVALHAPPGLYLLTITTPTGRWQQKVLVE